MSTEPPHIPDAIVRPAVAWLERQLYKLVALLSALLGGTFTDPDGRGVAWGAAVAVWLYEVWQSRRAEKSRPAAEPSAEDPGL